MDVHLPRIPKDPPIDPEYCRVFLSNLREWDPEALVILFCSRARHDQRQAAIMILSF